MKQKAFLGTWRGPFEEYLQKESSPAKPVYRPYSNEVRYVAGDCLFNDQTEERLVVGHETDHYPPFGAAPAKTRSSLLITGIRKDGTDFLRTVDERGVTDFALESKDTVSKSAKWKFSLPASTSPCSEPADGGKSCGAPAMLFKISDGQSPEHGRGARSVTVALTIGPELSPYWSGVIVRGWHRRI